MGVLNLSDASIKSGGKRTTFWDQATVWNEGLQLISTQSFSNVSDVDFDNVFSDTYVQYKIVADFTAAGGEFRAQWRASGSDITSANYNQQYLYYRTTTVSGARSTGRTEYEFGNVSAYDCVILEILNPYQTAYTSGALISNVNSETNGTNGSFLYAYGYSATTSFDGIRFFPQSGTFSGTISIYGYYKG